jgi:hypothetical protein
MSVSDEVSFFSRFTVKFAEISAAGVATAISGFLIAHVAGIFSAPAVTPVALPATMQAAPNVGGASSVSAISSMSGVYGSLRAPPVAADAGAQHVAPERDVRSPITQPERPVANATTAAPPPPRKPVTADTAAAEDKPRETESIEAKVRAALANADANRPAPRTMPSHQADVAARPPAAEAQRRPSDAPTASIAAAPRAADAAPTPIQPAAAPPAMAQPASLTSVDIQSRPVAGTAIAPSDQDSTQESVQASNQENTDASHHGLFPDLFAPFRKLPHLLRDDPPVPADQAPRPPMPVGQ